MNNIHGKNLDVNHLYMLDFSQLKMYDISKLIFTELQRSNRYCAIQRADGWWKSVRASCEYTASENVRTSGQRSVQLS